MTKLRAKLAGADRPLTAKAVAKFLVEKKHLTQREATEVLGSLVRSGVDVDPTPKEESPEDAADEATAIISPASAVEIPADPLPQLRSDAAEEDYEGSSIFEPFPTPSRDEPRPEDDIRLAPDSELDADQPTKVRSAKEPVADEPEGELPELGDFFNKPAATQPARPRAADRPLLEESLEGAAEVPPVALESKTRRRKKKKDVKRTNEWDSPLILLGGGGLARKRRRGAAAGAKSRRQRLVHPGHCRVPGLFGKLPTTFRPRPGPSQAGNGPIAQGDRGRELRDRARRRPDRA
jgi:hypothetical protein